MYTIKQAALRSGVNVPLLRQWERRYRIVAPTRTDSGYRLYDDEAIGRLRAMRALVDAGWSPRQAAEHVAQVGPEQLESAPSDRPGDMAGADALSRTFVDGAAAMDAAVIEEALDDMFAGGSFERIVEDRLYPALAALGDAWATGQVDVAGEHAASAAAIRRLGMVFEAAGIAGDGGAPVLVGLPPGVRHEAAALAFATAARRAGIGVLYLGPDVPIESWVTAVERTSARAVAFGVVMDQDIPAGDELVAALRAAHPPLTIAVGGRWSHVIGNGAVVRLPDRLRDAVEELRRAIG